MNELEARALLQRLMLVIQKIRSIAREQYLSACPSFRPVGEDDWIEVYSLIDPWIFGKHTLLLALEPMLARPAINPLDLYNMMTLFHHSSILKSSQTLYGSFPEPDSAWLRGWTRDGSEWRNESIVRLKAIHPCLSSDKVSLSMDTFQLK